MFVFVFNSSSANVMEVSSMHMMNVSNLSSICYHPTFIHLGWWIVLPSFVLGVWGPFQAPNYGSTFYVQVPCSCHSLLICQTTIGVAQGSTCSKCHMEKDWLEGFYSMQWNCPNLLLTWFNYFLKLLVIILNIFKNQQFKKWLCNIF